MVQKVKTPFTAPLIMKAIVQSFAKLNPFELWRNPVMFITEIGALITTYEAFVVKSELQGFTIHVSVWLWVTVLFANFAEAIAESRNQAQADA